MTVKPPPVTAHGDAKDEIFGNTDRQETYTVQVAVGVHMDYSSKDAVWVSDYRADTKTRTVQTDGGNDTVQFGQGIALKTCLSRPRAATCWWHCKTVPPRQAPQQP